MRYLITGGCGFLGSNLAHEVLQRGEELLVFDNLSRVGCAENLSWLRQNGSFSFVHGDVRHSHDVARTFADYHPDVVFHLAGQVAMTTSLARPRVDFEINALGSFNVLEAVRRHAPEAVVVYSSTNKVYGDLNWLSYDVQATRYAAVGYPDGFDEQIPFAPSSPYGVSKGAADSYMRDYAQTFGVRSVVFRHSSMYGGRQFATFDQGWVGWFCQKALELKAGTIRSFTIAGDGKQVRDVLHADDMRRLYLAAVQHIDRAAGQVFNVGGGMENSLSLRELFSLLEQLVEVEMRAEQTPWRASDQKVFVADVGKARELLGWAPETAPRAGVLSLLDWLRH